MTSDRPEYPVDALHNRMPQMPSVHLVNGAKKHKTYLVASVHDVGAVTPKETDSFMKLCHLRPFCMTLFIAVIMGQIHMLIKQWKIKISTCTAAIWLIIRWVLNAQYYRVSLNAGQWLTALMKSFIGCTTKTLDIDSYMQFNETIQWKQHTTILYCIFTLLWQFLTGRRKFGKGKVYGILVRCHSSERL